MEKIYLGKPAALPGKLERFGDKVDYFEDRLRNHYSTTTPPVSTITGIPVH